jgi:hypothetical protein
MTNNDYDEDEGFNRNNIIEWSLYVKVRFMCVHL